MFVRIYLDTDEVEAKVDKSSLSQGDEDANVSVEDCEEKAEDGESLDVGGVEYSSSSKSSSESAATESPRTSSDWNRALSVS